MTVRELIALLSQENGDDIVKTSGPLSSQLCTIYRSRFHLLTRIVYAWYGFQGRYSMLILEEE